MFLFCLTFTLLFTESTVACMATRETRLPVTLLPVMKDCARCPVLVKIVEGDFNGIPKKTIEVDEAVPAASDGCIRRRLLCSGVQNAQRTFFRWFSANGAQVGESLGTGHVQQNLVCNDNKQWILEGGNNVPVASVECISA